jgi:hypothetical protein
MEFDLYLWLVAELDYLCFRQGVVIIMLKSLLLRVCRPTYSDIRGRRFALGGQYAHTRNTPTVRGPIVDQTNKNPNSGMNSLLPTV